QSKAEHPASEAVELAVEGVPDRAQHSQVAIGWVGRVDQDDAHDLEVALLGAELGDRNGDAGAEYGDVEVEGAGDSLAQSPNERGRTLSARDPLHVHDRPKRPVLALG